MHRLIARTLLLATIAAASLLFLAPASTQQPTLRGFTPARAVAQRVLEAKLQTFPDPARAEKHLRTITSTPHMAGTAGSRRVAEYLRDQLRSFGLEAELASYRVLLPHPKSVSLSLTAPDPMTLARPEEPIPGDPFSADARAVMAFNGYSPSGDVTAQVVYANYGLPEDYERLAALKIDVKGKIVLVRYGRSFRGVKSKAAEERGAAGVLIFSDPADDGYVQGDMYPRGPWRPMSGIQRGSVLYIFQYPGDPSTPSGPSVPGTARVEQSAATNLTRVPTMPISPRDAQEILKRLDGPRVPRGWQGGLPLTYHVGPGGATARMKLEMDYQQREIFNVIGKLKSEKDDEWVLVGNHHDAWVFGAVDPNSGSSVVLETARSLAELAKGGWKPRRSILFCFWDAEEFGLIGSTEWVEHHADELKQKAVAYVNLDAAVSGPNFGGSATPSLKELIREAAREVKDPQTGKTVYDAWRERTAAGQGRRPITSETPNQPAITEDTPLGNLGSGSDYTAFYHHLGIPSLDMGFGGEYGVYHSIYDNFHWMKKFGDPDFAYHATMARVAGIVLLRLAEADVVPLDYEAYAEEIDRYLRELAGSVQNVPGGSLNLKPLAEAAAAFRKAATSRTREVRSSTYNRALVGTEQSLLVPQGLVGRPWFRHTIFAPGTYTGYAAVIFPGIREAIDRNDWTTAQREADAAVAALQRAAARLNAIP